MNVYFETLGCPKNFNDSQFCAGILEKNGYRVVEDLSKAQIIVVNTCGFINDAKVESINAILEMAKQKKILIVSGCLSQRYGSQLFDDMPEIDIFIGVNDYHRLPELIKEFQSRGRLMVVDGSVKNMDPSLRKIPHGAYSETIKIAEGCDHHCTYCIIPKIRGPFQSRQPEEIMEEAQRLVKKGIRELILIAQDTTGYGWDLYEKSMLAELLKTLCTIEDLKWIRLMYCYEDRITPELIQVMADNKKICPYIDLPIQHCCDGVLQRMARRSTKESITKTINTLRDEVKNIHIRTTLITGFPGETQEDHEELLAFVQEMEFDRLGVFTYSKEEDTPAARMEDTVSQEVKEQRKEEIMLTQMNISLKKNREKIGHVLEVLVEGKDGENTYYGRTAYDAPEIDNQVIFTATKDHKEGDFVPVKIIDGYDYDLIGEAK